MDFFPTILELANFESYNELDGVSIAQHLLHSKPLSARTLFWQHGEQYAVCKGKWKLIVSGNHEKPELYNLKDMEEKINVSHEYPDILNELLHELKEWPKNVFEGVNYFLN